VALQTGDYWDAIKAGVRERSFSAVGSHIRYVREANHNARELTRRGDMPSPASARPQRMWVPLSDERQKVPPVEIDARLAMARLRTEPSARKVAAHEAMLQADAAPLGLNKMRASAHLLGQAAQERVLAQGSKTTAARAEHIHNAKDAIYDALNERRIHDSQGQAGRLQQTAGQSAMTDRQTRQAATTGFVQRMLADERKAQRGEGQKPQQEDGQKQKKQMRQ
jgi:hypothetical protein